MKIGIFDSGIGGLQILKAIIQKLPNYDYLYYGDTTNMPYGSKTQEQIYQYTKAGIDFLARKQAGLIIIACNTASTNALRKIQQEYIPQNHPSLKVLGVIIPTAEAVIATQAKTVGVIATPSTVHSNVYIREIQKLRPNINVIQVAAPGLAINIEQNNHDATKIIFQDAVNFLKSHGAELIVLGCTHYGIITEKMPDIIPNNTSIINQNQIIPEKLEHYLTLHPEITTQLSEQGTNEFFVTKLTNELEAIAQTWFGNDITIHTI